MNWNSIKYRNRAKKEVIICKTCEKEAQYKKLLSVVKSLYPNGKVIDKNFSILFTKHTFSCGVDGHKDFIQDYEKLTSRGKRAGCQICRYS